MFPGQSVEIPRMARKAATAPAGARRFSPPMQALVDEHQVILLAIAQIPAAVAALGRDGGEPQRQTIRDLVDFIREFADRYHHAKEEEILFGYFDGNAEIIQAMRAEHDIGRSHVRAAAEAVEAGDRAAVRQRLTAYGALLTEHIRKEDEILYPWMNRQLTDSQVGRLFAQFQEVDVRFGDRPARYRERVAAWERLLGSGFGLAHGGPASVPAGFPGNPAFGSSGHGGPPSRRNDKDSS